MWKNDEGGREVYSVVIIKQIPRLLGLIDRNPYSPTYGCCDRNFWHYNIIDFPCARMQELCLTLALIYKGEYPNNRYYKKDRIKDLSVAAMEFWTKIQNKDGSFDEWYPNEHSFVTTAFSSYAVSEAYMLMKDFIMQGEKYEIEQALKKAGNWLIKHDEEVSNQQAGALSALYNIYLITKNERYLENAKEKLNTLLQSQSKEGWFPEYGGADIGYLSVLIDYLGKYYQKSKNEEILTNLNSAIDFLTYFSHPDLGFGGEYGSRNTEFILPHGLEIVGNQKPNAREITSAVRRSLKKYGITFDDRYLCYFGYCFLQAWDDSSLIEGNMDLPYKTEFIKYFPLAQIYIHSSPLFYSIVGLRKGGVIKVFNKEQEKLVYDDCGMIGELSNGKHVSTQWLDRDYKIKVNDKDVRVSGEFHLINYHRLSTLILMLFRLIQSFGGRYYKFSEFVKENLRKKIITRSKTVPIKFHRRISFDGEKIRIEDRIDIKNNLSFEYLMIGGKFSLIYVPSSRFFSEHLDTEGYKLSEDELKELNGNKKILISREISSEGLKEGGVSHG